MQGPGVGEKTMRLTSAYIPLLLKLVARGMASCLLTPSKSKRLISVPSRVPVLAVAEHRE